MLLKIFGLATEPTWWYITRIPDDGGAALEEVLQEQLPRAIGLTFYTAHGPLEFISAERLLTLWPSGCGEIFAKPQEALIRTPPTRRLRLMTTTGPDAGRSFPLTRSALSVGRGAARAQVRDPWLSSAAFIIRLSSNGPLVETKHHRSEVWSNDTIYTAGSTGFMLVRDPGPPLRTPRDPGPFEINPGPPPSPPNLVLQVIGAAAPLLIGIVLMLVTGMWYFLLFSGISVIIAIVMISMYRRSRVRYLLAIEEALDEVTQRFSHLSAGPHDFILALSNPDADPLSLNGDHAEFPLVTFGTGVSKAGIHQVDDTSRWDPHLSRRVRLIMSLRPGQRTVVVGDSATRRPIKRWLTAQLLRHSAASQTGVTIDGVTVGKQPILDLSDHCSGDCHEHQHCITFVESTHLIADEHTTIIDLQQRTAHGQLTASDIDPLGISDSTLQLLSSALRLDKPRDNLSIDVMQLSDVPLDSEARVQLVTELGTGALGLSVDLVADGPHLLITGTTGSGKSELILTVLCGLARRYPPEQMSMILLDFKGGSSFNVLADLPHTMSVETNHVSSTAFRSLHAISAELHRREQLFAEHKVPDFTSFHQAYPDAVLPRLVVAIDELRILVDHDPEASTVLARLAATGRSLGFHLILATQRTQGAVNADIRANIGCSISLRTATEHDSWDVLGTAEAFHISPATPGRAYFKAGAAAPRLFQTARYVLDSEPTRVLATTESGTTGFQQTTHWPAAVQQLKQRAADLPLPPPAILPALPERIAPDTLHTPGHPNLRFSPIGLIDNPAECAQYPIGLGDHRVSTHTVLTQSVAWIGAADSGINAAADVIIHHVQDSGHRHILLEGRQFMGHEDVWDMRLEALTETPDSLQKFLDELHDTLRAQHKTTLVITEWGSWSTAMVTGSFQGFEERLIALLRQFPSMLTVYVFGNRELAGGRLLGMIPDRFYLPKSATAEHQLIWPTLIAIPPLPGRAVFVSAERPTGGLEVQLALR